MFCTETENRSDKNCLCIHNLVYCEGWFLDECKFTNFDLIECTMAVMEKRQQLSSDSRKMEHVSASVDIGPSFCRAAPVCPFINFLW